MENSILSITDTTVQKTQKKPPKKTNLQKKLDNNLEENGKSLNSQKNDASSHALLKRISINQFNPSPMTSKEIRDINISNCNQEISTIVPQKPISQITKETEDIGNKLEKIDLGVFNVEEVSDEEEAVHTNKSNKRGKNVSYVTEKTFTSNELELAKQYIKDQAKWRIKSRKYETAIGLITPYVCNQTKVRAIEK